MAAAEVTEKSYVDIAPNLGGKLVRGSFKKGHADDWITLPSDVGKKVVWAYVVKDADLTVDAAAAVDGLKVTLSSGVGDRTGLFLVE